MITFEMTLHSHSCFYFYYYYYLFVYLICVAQVNNLLYKLT